MDTASDAEFMTPGRKAHATGRWAETICRVLIRRVASRWQLVSFRGNGGGEWCGVVDLLAIRKRTAHCGNPKLQKGDRFDKVLVQIKGGSSAMPTLDDCKRLREVARIESAEVVLFSWRRRALASFSRLDLDTLEWSPVAVAEVFA